MSKEIKINRLILTIGKKELELTPDEARKLKDELNNLLGFHYPQPHPIIIERPVPVGPPLPYSPWYTTCDSNSVSITTS